jgi:hypothetical protein
MSTDDENYEDFVKRYRASKGEPAAGPKFSPVNKHLAKVLAVGFAFYLFSSWISADLDRAIAEQDSPSAQTKPGRNPWAKD